MGGGAPNTESKKLLWWPALNGHLVSLNMCVVKKDCLTGVQSLTVGPGLSNQHVQHLSIMSG